MVKGKRKKILAIDYGRTKLGLAIASTSLAEPYKVLRYKKEEEVLQKIADFIKLEKVDEVVLGISEGDMAAEIKIFGNKLSKKINIPVKYQDETLSTQDAQILSIRSGIQRKKRKEMEDAYAACLILQNYLDR